MRRLFPFFFASVCVPGVLLLVSLTSAHAQLVNCAGPNCPPTYHEPQACQTPAGRDSAINVLIGGNLTITRGAEAEGRVVVLGNLNHSEATNETFNVGYAGVGSCVIPPALSDYLTVGGNIASTNSTLRLIVGGGNGGFGDLRGNLRIKGSISPSNVVIDIAGSIIPNPALNLAPFQSLITQTASTSECIVGQTPSTAVSVVLGSGGLVITNNGGTNSASETYYVNVDGAGWPATAVPVIISGFDDMDNLIINVSGANPILRVNYFQRNATVSDIAWNNFREHLLWNFHEAQTLTFDAATAGWEGSVIAPVATNVDIDMVGLNGRFVTSGNVTLDNPGFEFHNYPWKGPLPSCFVPVYDLALRKYISSSTASQGDTLTYTIAVVNDGNSPATGVTVRDSLNAGVAYLSSTADQGSYNPATGIWTLGTVGVGDSLTLTIMVQVREAGVWFNTAEICAMNEIDENSTPCNGEEGEDDIDRRCFSVPYRICGGDSILASVPAGYSDVVWFRQETVGGPLLLVATGNDYTITTIGSFTFTTTSGNCPASGCCPIVVISGDCCKPEVCVPVVFAKTQRVSF